jgi:hypothetical protein
LYGSVEDPPLINIEDAVVEAPKRSLPKESIANMLDPEVEATWTGFTFALERIERVDPGVVVAPRARRPSAPRASIWAPVEDANMNILGAAPV